MLEVWFETLRSYAPETLAQLEFVIVDDHGTPPAEIPLDVQDLLPCQLLRATKDIPWNQPGARNLAATRATTPLILFVDPDMVFEEPMMQRLLEEGARLDRGKVIRFCIRHRSGRQKGHVDTTSPNTWFMHVQDFIDVKGYDEDYSGHKGWSDVQLLDVLKAAYKVRQLKDVFAEFYSTAEVKDAAVTTLDRCVKHNKYMRLGKHRQAQLLGSFARFARESQGKMVRFEWEQVL